jgi:hypothetical protein
MGLPSGTDQHMTRDQGPVRGQGAEDLEGLLILEPVETAAQGFAIRRDAGQPVARSVQHRRVTPKGHLDVSRVQPLPGVADRRVGRRPLPVQPAERVQWRQPGLDEPLDLAVRRGVRQDRQNAGQQRVLQAIQPTLGTAVIGNRGEKCRQQHQCILSSEKPIE